jgi:hypothetical protein
MTHIMVPSSINPYTMSNRLPAPPKVPRECTDTTPVGADLTWEQYCAAVGVDLQGAREATVVRALWSMCGGKGSR